MERWLRIDELARMLYSVSEEKWAKVKKFRKLEDANRGLIGEILIRTIIRNKFNITNDQIVITTGPYGKPYAVGIPSFHFNIAHSGRWIVCAVDCEPVGIDIEEIKPVSFDIAKYFFQQKNTNG
ncbi:4'-phosphopantetheinyl transferase family protein [Aneurinibacillus tyrosinisolvens]|uniref:4'-phosphopantetheinyl transferase family protein n=1 Tax=Aneurinibacillus tyrosinisolvens TaxID=1443435 RepID=UPI000B092BEE|nr:phosphopantetheinyl transferase [Aneurinibacillus tyrosinisolvens]